MNRSSKNDLSLTATGRLVAVMSAARMYFFSGDLLIRALDGADLELRAGEIVGLLGPRGCGKSTALRLLAGEMRPTEGTVQVFGGAPTRGGVRRRIALVPQEGAAASERGVSRWLGFFKKLLGKRSSAAEGAVGKHRSAGVILALVNKAELVLLDEPFAGRSPAECREMRDLIQSLAAQGKTVVLTGSLVEEPARICTRLAFLDGGRIVVAGSLEETLNHSDALRLLGGLLPVRTAERVRKVLREDLANLAKPENAGSENTVPSPPAPAVTRPNKADQPDAKLARLVKGEAGAVETKDETPSAPADSIRYSMLEALADKPEQKQPKQPPQSGQGA